MNEHANPQAVAAQSGAAGKIVLVGFMGTGKSTVSKLLAEQLGWRRIDSDEQIELKSGKKISELFAEGGESYFRDIESETLRALLESDESAVIATGGGAVLRQPNRANMLKHAFVVALKAEESHILARVQNDTNRPLLQGDAAANVKRLLEERRTAYDFANASYDTTGLSPDAVCKLIVEQWKSMNS